MTRRARLQSLVTAGRSAVALRFHGRTLVLLKVITDAILRAAFNQRTLMDMLGNIPAMIDLSSFGLSSMEGVLRWETAVRSMESVLPALQDAVTLVCCSWIAVLIPLSVFRRAHPVIARILRVSSLFVGGVCWWQAVIVTYRLMGWLAVSIGLLCAGIGIIPMSLFAAGVRGDWDVFRSLAIGAILTVVPRIIAKFITIRRAKTQLPATIGSYYSSDFSAW